MIPVCVCQVTGARLNSKMLIPNHGLRTAIEDFKARSSAIASMGQRIIADE